MFGYSKVPTYARTRTQDRPDDATLRAIIDSHLQALQQQIEHNGQDYTGGEFVVSVKPWPTASDDAQPSWDILTSWGEPA